MKGLGTTGIADALTNFLAERFPDFYVYRSFLGLDGADASAARNADKTAGRIVVIPEAFSFDPSAHGRIAKQTICRIVVLKDFDRSRTDEATFAPASEVDPLIKTLEEIAETFTETTAILSAGGKSTDAYAPEARLASDAPLYDESNLMKGRYVGSLRVAVFEKFDRAPNGKV